MGLFYILTGILMRTQLSKKKIHILFKQERPCGSAVFLLIELDQNKVEIQKVDVSDAKLDTYRSILYEQMPASPANPH